MTNIFINGTFDILHPGHLRLLKFAKELGGKVLVAIDTDARVKQLKGQYRPVNSQNTRKELLEAIRWVDAVEIFGSEDELVSLIKSHSPCIMVKGSDYMDKAIIGQEYCEAVVFYELEDEYSTTKTIEYIINR